jgi:RNase P subunit RPR2
MSVRLMLKCKKCNELFFSGVAVGDRNRSSIPNMIGTQHRCTNCGQRDTYSTEDFTFE